MLQHLHAGDQVKAASKSAQLLDSGKAQPRIIGEATAAIRYLARLVIGADRVWKQVHHLGHKGAVTTSVIQQARTGPGSDQTTGQEKAPAMAQANRKAA